jgi:hypothetical protein
MADRVVNFCYVLPFGLETIPTINRFFTTGLERNHRLHAAAETYSRIHLAFTTSAGITLLFFGVSAARTTSRFVLKSFGGVELLLACGEGKGLTAVLTG